MVEKLKSHLRKPTDNQDHTKDQHTIDNKDQKENKIDLSKEDFINKNLNKLSTEELNLYKAEMEKDYLKNAILPESDKFVYDIQKDFDINNCNNEWDDEDEEV